MSWEQICPLYAKKWHMHKLLDMHLWRKDTSTYVTYEVASIKDVARITPHT